MGCFSRPGEIAAAVLATCALLAGGCSRSDYQLVEVSGTVTLDGDPLKGAHVTFQPIAEGNDRSPGPGSVGVCDANGHFTLETIDGEPGAVVGRHRVKIRTNAFREAPASDSDTKQTFEQVPPWYNDQSQLEFTVPDEGTEAADFPLSTQPPR